MRLNATAPAVFAFLRRFVGLWRLVKQETHILWRGFPLSSRAGWARRGRTGRPRVDAACRERAESGRRVVYDRWWTPRAAHARPSALVEYAGKRGGKPSPKQRDISLRLIELARAGKRVCRLKGGDPFVFGRGGEEALALVEAGVPFRIVPGVSAGIGGLAYAGIPVTHRDINQSVTFLTGHDQTGLTPSAIDWVGVARGAPVIVMYMAIKHLGQIATALILAGRSAGEPVAIVANATTASQRVLETTLGGAAADLSVSDIEPPAIVVVGEVVRLRRGSTGLGR
jgi:uroporphyrin-III C-methyltransferase